MLCCFNSFFRAEVCTDNAARIRGNGLLAAPGTVLEAGRDGVFVACGEGALRLLELQKAGARRLPVAQFLTGMPVARGAAFSLPAA